MTFESIFQNIISRIREKVDSAGPHTLPADFDADAYLELNPDVVGSNLSAKQHYARHGAKEGRAYKALDPEELPADFNPDVYRMLNPDLQEYKGDLIKHYLREGMISFRKYASDKPPAIPRTAKYSRLPKDFDPETYAAINPELQGSNEALVNHYIDHGIAEGRLYAFPKILACYGRSPGSQRKSILVVSHEASRTGAPILSWNLLGQYIDEYEVVVLLLGSGTLLENFQFDASATYVSESAKSVPAVAKHVVSTLCRHYCFDFAIVNSVECTQVCESLTLHGVPSICLIHEFAASSPALKKFEMAEAWAARIVFSASITKENAIDQLKGQRFRDAMVVPQGRCLIPASRGAEHEAASRSKVNVYLKNLSEEHRLVIGLGTICYRKGVDAFIECAHQMVAMSGNETLRFLWIGHGLTNPYEPNYAMLLPDQIKRSGLQDVLTIFEDTDDLLSVYERADLLVLSSRLDPLPNVAIDALHLGVPLVCFDKCSGIVQAMEKHGLSDTFVAPYFNINRMAELALDTVGFKQSKSGVAAIRKMAEAEFSMKHYSETLTQIAYEANDELKSIRADILAIRDASTFDVNYYHGISVESRQSIRRKASELDIWNYFVGCRSGRMKRKPCPGFHPLAYARRFGLDSQASPLAHYSKLELGNRRDSGLPLLIRPDPQTQLISTHQFKIALHVHAYYVELLDDIFHRISRNHSFIDIFITTTSSSQAEVVLEIAERHTLLIKEVIVLENRGRNVLPLFKMLKKLAGAYDLIGHIHTKKSEFFPDAGAIERWRDMVLSNLLGCDEHPAMADLIFHEFHENRDLDIVFPDDPNILDWGNNKDIAASLLGEAPERLPKHFEFPVSTMFWARASYLRTFIHMDLLERNCPDEPIANDGTVLHAFERLLGSQLTDTPGRIGLTFIDGVYR